MNIIEKQKQLEEFCSKVSKDDYITIDTEFIRDKTYFPKLCLIQIAGSDAAALIDPLADKINLEPVFKLLRNDRLIKVFHACRQDIEIFYLLSGEIPKNIFDTQIAASMCGYGESVSYENLVNRIVKQELDKTSRFTDWSARPLSEKQLAYALSDVTHLRGVYEHLRSNIKDAGRMSWVIEEHEELYNPSLYKVDPQNAWKRLKYGTMRPKNLAILREIAAFRENEARVKNVPRGRVLRDDALLEIASVIPKNEDEFKKLRAIDKGIAKKKAQQIMECINIALALPSSEYPQQKKRHKTPDNINSIIAMLQLLLKVKADVNGIAPSIIADKKELEAVAMGDDKSQLLTGWRYDVFGKDAKLLISGKLKLSLNPDISKVVFEVV